MKDLFIPYELAVIAKEKGFNEKCFGVYNHLGEIYIGLEYDQPQEHMPNGCKAPLYQQIDDWFRIKHKLFIEIDQQEIEDNDGNYSLSYAYRIFDKKDDCVSEYPNIRGYGHYYKTFDRAIEEAFKLI